MTLNISSRQLKILIPAAGLLGLGLRTMLYATGVDEKGLLITGHWAGTATWLLTAAVALVLLLECRTLADPGEYSSAFPASPISAAGSVLAGLAFILCPNPEAPSQALRILVPALQFAAAAALAVVGFCRFSGRKPLFLLHCTVCLYLALRLVCQYRVWSADPQLQNYAFYLGAHIALMITAYQLAAFDAGFGSSRKLWGSSLAAVYLSMVAAAANEDAFFLLCCALWTWANLFKTNPVKEDTP